LCSKKVNLFNYEQATVGKYTFCIRFGKVVIS
jgi:hypothetical protein